VASLRTIAGNLDHVALSRFHNVGVLTDSLNPIDYAFLIRNIPQLHFAAEKDRVVPLFISQSFAERLGDTSYQSIIVVEGTTHDSGWEAKWPELLSTPLYHSSNPL
jgi:pimeloyl-ACP methyl ester carboxylesterase